MAEAEHPVSELYPLGGTVSLESTPSESAEPKSEITEHSTTPAKQPNCSSLGVNREPSDQEQSLSEHFVPPRASGHLHSLVGTHCQKVVMNATSDTPQASRTVQGINLTSLAVHRSHSDTLLPHSDTCGPAYHVGDKSIQEAESLSMLACKQPMQLQHCNIVTTICRGNNSGESGAQQPQSRCMCVASPKEAVTLDGVPLKSDKALCYSCIHHANFEDTFAAYCHPQPIPAPSQLLPQLADVESSCNLQRAVAPPSAMNHLTLPRLISSVSETGLDAKYLLRCCNLTCSLINPLLPSAGTQTQKHLGGEECCSSPLGHVRTMTRDTGTMTAHKELRDVGVQTGQTVTPHVFPQICLAEENRSEASCSQTANTDTVGGKRPGGGFKSPVKEVKWDAEGMTWEVYGASVDPEELGLAIQRHLELQIKETASHAAKMSHHNTNTSRQSRNNSCQRKKIRIIGSIRTPACCAQTTAVD
ncbi:uncharacterized protein LOC113131488 [Mastacembelus armatus]|uniref:uncharacterized protein LOC113131488 n=1 Tax=Mastacembelus armatus TaxID=205130 RepID=UPI000E45BAD6|nr:uncharacterized protein LOC113131488 [Mastacembelus armatus]